MGKNIDQQLTELYNAIKVSGIYPPKLFFLMTLFKIVQIPQIKMELLGRLHFKTLTLEQQQELKQVYGRSLSGLNVVLYTIVTEAKMQYMAKNTYYPSCLRLLFIRHFEYLQLEDDCYELDLQPDHESILTRLIEYSNDCLDFLIPHLHNEEEIQLFKSIIRLSTHHQLTMSHLINDVVVKRHGKFYDFMYHLSK